MNMTDKRKILLLDDNHRDRAGIASLLENWGYHVTTAHEGEGALQCMGETPFELVIAGFEVPGTSGIPFLRAVKSRDGKTSVIFTSSHASVENAVEAVREGALDYLLKPLDPAQLRLLVEEGLHGAQAPPAPPAAARKRAVKTRIVTRNVAMERLLQLTRRVADSSASVLIQGESGTGKELFARYIHENSKRKDAPFIALNCAALPENLLESELFGHEKGAFTGAVARKTGKVEAADGGTLLLDEITEMQIHLQSKLLRVIQERELDRVGGTGPVKVDVRILATTNRDVRAAIEGGEFREDLYYRLNVIPLKIPSLRLRRDDIELLSRFFIDKYNEIDGRNVKGLTEDALETLKGLSFNGNVRELENIIQRATLLCDGGMIGTGDLFLEEEPGAPAEPIAAGAGAPAGLVPGPLKEMEKQMIFQALDQTEGNRTRASKILGISVRTLRNKLNEYKENVGTDS